MMISDAELDDLRDRHPVAEIARRWVRLRPNGRCWVGPCPVHSPDPQSTDSTSFEIKENGSWVCATCCDGGDVIKLVRLREGIGFREAVAWLGGTQAVDEKRSADLARAREAKEEKRVKEASYFRDRERQALWDIWQRAEHWPGTAVEAYLALRGLTNLPGALRVRCVPDMPYFAKAGDQLALHRGPAMVAPILRPDRHFGGLHLTYIDLAAPKGKLAIVDPADGKPLPSRKSRGSVTAGYIDLLPFKAPAVPQLAVVGEGIEKVMAMYLALAADGRDLAAIAWRSCVSLGNLGGRALASIAHPELLDRGHRMRRVPGPLPQDDDPGIPLEDTITEAVILGDTTSDRFMTDCAIARAAARWRARLVLVAWPPAGVDFDDLLRTNISTAEGNDHGAGEARA